MTKAWLVLIGRRLAGTGVPGVTGVAAGVVLLGLGLVGVYERRHVSADFRRSLVAALASDPSDGSVRRALPRARGLVHTWRDREECAKLQRAVEALDEAQRHEVALNRRLRLAQAQLDAEIHSEKLMIVAEMAYLDSHQAMPAGLASDVAGEQQRRERVRDQRRRDEDSAWLQVLQERLDARVLLQELRVDLGLVRPESQVRWSPCTFVVKSCCDVT